MNLPDYVTIEEVQRVCRELVWGHFNPSSSISISIWLAINCMLTNVLYRQNGSDAAKFTHPNELRGMNYEACETHGRYRYTQTTLYRLGQFNG